MPRLLPTLNPAPSEPPVRRGGRHRHWRRAIGVAAITGALALAACGSRPPVLREPAAGLRVTTTTAPVRSTVIGTTAPSTTATAAAPSTSATVVPQALQAEPDTMQGLVATPIGAPSVHTAPTSTSASVRIPRVNAAGVPTVFAVVGGADASWIEVLLPTRPNGATGWVQHSTVLVTRTDLRLFVSLGGRRLTVKRTDQIVLDVPIAIGTTANPTPTGASFLTELLDTAKPEGTYGRFAYGLALHSDTLSEFAGGNGQIGIHGTNRPDLIGLRVSHGCVRLNNADVLRLVSLKLPLGTPVFVF